LLPIFCFPLFFFATLFLSGLLAAHVIKNSSYATLTATETNKKTGDKTRAKTRRAGGEAK